MRLPKISSGSWFPVTWNHQPSGFLGKISPKPPSFGDQWWFNRMKLWCLINQRALSFPGHRLGLSTWSRGFSEENHRQRWQNVSLARKTTYVFFDWWSFLLKDLYQWFISYIYVYLFSWLLKKLKGHHMQAKQIGMPPLEMGMQLTVETVHKFCIMMKQCGVEQCKRVCRQ